MPTANARTHAVYINIRAIIASVYYGAIQICLLLLLFLLLFENLLHPIQQWRFHGRGQGTRHPRPW
jgi:hypothetical protein